MGVIKNLMVRVGADVSGVVYGMKSASGATGQAKTSIQKHTVSIKQAVKNHFGGAGQTVRQYAQALRQTREANAVAGQNVERLSDKLNGLESVYEAVKTATAGMDLGKPLAEQIAEAENGLVKIEHRRKQIEKSLASISSPREMGSKRTQALQAELKALTSKSMMAEARLQQLNQVASSLGTQNMGHASAAGLQKLQQQIVDTRNELTLAQSTADATGKKLGSMGSVASYAVGRGVGKLWQALKAVGRVTVGGVKLGLRGIGAAARAALPVVKKLGSSLLSLAGRALRGIAGIPGKLLRIGKAAQSGSGGVKNLVRSIRNIGVVSLGLKIAGGMFGKLRSIISNYISSNEELSAATSLLTHQLGQSLEPAIRLVIVAMQKLMPIVTRISAAVSSVLQSIIGEVGEVQYAYRKLGTYGFDQITKADNEQEQGDQTQEQSALVAKLTAWIEQLKSAFTSGNWAGLGKLLGDGINSAMDSLGQLDLGPKIQTFLQNLNTTLHSAMKTVDWNGIGQALAGGVNGLFTAMNNLQIGLLLGTFVSSVTTALYAMVTGIDFGGAGATLARQLNIAVATTDWSKIGTTIGLAVGGLAKTVALTLGNIDWGLIGQAIKDLLQGVADGLELSGMSATLGKKLSEALGNLNTAIDSFDWNGSGSALADKFNGVVAGANWLKFGQTISAAVSTTLRTLSSTITTFDWLGLGIGIADCINGLDWVGMLSNLATNVSSILKGGLDLLAGFAQKLNWAKLSSDVWNGLNGVLTGIDWSGILSKGFELLGSALGGASSMIATYWANVATSLSRGLTDAWTYFEGFIDDAGGDVGKGILNGVKAAFKGIATWIKSNLWTPFKTGFEKAFGSTGDTVSSVFQKIPDKLKKPLNDIISTVNTLLSSMTSGINSMIKALNALSFDIPDWVPGIGGETFGLNLKTVTAPQIPKLAKGGVVTKATQIIAGEQGKEAIVPLENNTGWFDKLLEKATVLLSGGGSGRPVIIQLMIGKRKLTEFVIEDINQITKSTGACPIKV